MTTHTVALRGGTLALTVARADLPLEALCTFGTRRNPKRPYLFISKVLGRHIPARPSAMLDAHERLAAKLDNLAGPVLVVGMAETATGLGQGVYEALLRQTGRADALFLPTTRYSLRSPLAFTFDESHSHATEHRVYLPAPELRPLFDQARTLVLVDDEISTGRTLAELAALYRQRNPHLRQVCLVSLLDWLSPERRAAIAERIGLPVAYHSLLQGTFDFTPAPGFTPGPMPDVVGKGHHIDDLVTGSHPRLGVIGLAPLSPVLGGEGTGVRGSAVAASFQLADEVRQVGNLPPRGSNSLVLGTGEFVHLPFLLALDWERQGHDVWFQAVTRSPILPGEGAASALECIDNYGDDIPNYVYNLLANSHERVFIGYETHTLPAAHRLGEQLNATGICF